MHDPQWVAFEVNLPFFKDKYHKYRSFLTIWHVDPEKDGSDDSCGSFIREQHLPKEMVEKVKSEFKSEQKFWYTPDNVAKWSEIAMLTAMYRRAAYIFFGKNWKKTNKFLRKHIADIIHFAENDIDSLADDLRRIQRPIEQMASIIICDIARKNRPWYKHPRWHIHHWKIQFVLWRSFYHRYLRKCHDCGTRGQKGSWVGTYRNGRIVYVCNKCEATHVAAKF